MKAIIARTTLAAAALAMPLAASASGVIDGRWMNPKGSVIVRIAPCGNAYCGNVANANAKAKATARKGGTPSLVGTQILRNMRPTGPGAFKGQAFDPKRNIHAPATIRLVGPSTLVVRGCLVSGFLCKEQRWTRVN